MELDRKFAEFSADFLASKSAKSIKFTPKYNNLSWVTFYWTGLSDIYSSTKSVTLNNASDYRTVG